MTGPPVEPPPIDRAAVLPSVDEVAMLERTRTVGPGGHDIPMFTDQTRPTADEAAALIEHAADEVLGRLPTNVAEQYWPAVTRAISLRAAQLVETSYYRESAVELGASVEAALSSLAAAVPDDDTAVAAGVSAREQAAEDVLAIPALPPAA